MSDFQQKGLLVIGATNPIGAAISRLGASEGYTVSAHYFSSNDFANSLVAEITGTGGGARAFKADVRNPADVASLFDAAIDFMGGISAVVYAASVKPARQPFTERSADELQNMMGVTVLGGAYCLQEAARRMSVSGGGSGGAIVSVSSLAARYGGYRIAHYAAAKSALASLTQGIARELAGDGIRANVVSPGVISEAEAASAEGSAIPIGRTGTPGEVAETVMWLLSSKASYVTGADIVVAGGR